MKKKPVNKVRARVNERKRKQDLERRLIIEEHKEDKLKNKYRLYLVYPYKIGAFYSEDLKTCELAKEQKSFDEALKEAKRYQKAFKVNYIYYRHAGGEDEIEEFSVKEFLQLVGKDELTAKKIAEKLAKRKQNAKTKQVQAQN